MRKPQRKEKKKAGDGGVRVTVSLTEPSYLVMEKAPVRAGRKPVGEALWSEPAAAKELRKAKARAGAGRESELWVERITVSAERVEAEPDQKQAAGGQEYQSAGTSVNSKKAPSVFRRVKWAKGTRNLDWGGGKYDTATEYMASIGCENAIYDPFNRPAGANWMVLMGAPYDTATISNVLNVIKERHVRLQTVETCMLYVRDGGTVYITVYGGDGSGEGRKTKEGCWQMNKPLQFYADELAEAGYDLRVRRNVIMIRKPGREAPGMSG